MNDDICFVIVIYEFNHDLIRTIESIVEENSNVSIFIKSAKEIDHRAFKKIYSYSPNIVIHTKDDSGIYDAWNQSISNDYVLKHRYLTFFGAGDLLTKHSLEKLSKNIQKNEFDVLTSKSIDTYADGTSIINGAKMDKKKFQKYFCINHSGVLYRTSWIKSKKFDISYKSSGDYAFLLKHLNDAKFSFLDHPVSIYPVGGISSSSIMPIKESFRARKEYSSISMPYNILITLKAIVAFLLKSWSYK